MSQRLTAEQAEAAWTWQARGVAHEMQLNEEKTAKLVDAYVGSRTHLRDELQKLREEAAAQRGEADGRGGRGGGEGGGGQGGDLQRPDRSNRDPGGIRAKYNEMNEAERTALAEALNGFLSAERSEKAMAALGSFSGPWDTMVHALVGLELEDATMYQALVPVRHYLDALSKARQEAGQTGDRRGGQRGEQPAGQRGGQSEMREAMQEARTTLQEELGAILNEEQMAKYTEATSRRRGRGTGDAPARGRPAESAAPANATVGQPAPAFALKDHAGTAYALADYKGKIVILQWINPDCPVCRRVASTGLVSTMRTNLAALTDNLVYLTVNSTNYMEPEVGAAYLKSHKIDAPVLIDKDGTVGHLYHARTTPHMFVIDAEGVLRYDGAFDDDQRGNKGDKATNYVVNAVRQIVNGEDVKPDSTRSYGCSVKYASK